MERNMQYKLAHIMRRTWYLNVNAGWSDKTTVKTIVFQVICEYVMKKTDLRCNLPPILI